MKEPTATTRFVIAGNWSQFMNWLRQDEFNGKNAVYVGRTRDIVGRNRESVEIIKVGTWYENHEGVDSLERLLGVRI